MERRVFALLCQGMSNKEIAEARGRSEATVKHQVSEILRKCKVPSRARLLAKINMGTIDAAFVGCVVSRRRRDVRPSLCHSAAVPAAVAPVPFADGAERAGAYGT